MEDHFGSEAAPQPDSSERQQPAYYGYMFDVRTAAIAVNRKVPPSCRWQSHNGHLESNHCAVDDDYATVDLALIESAERCSRAPNFGDVGLSLKGVTGRRRRTLRTEAERNRLHGTEVGRADHSSSHRALAVLLQLLGSTFSSTRASARKHRKTTCRS